MFTENQFSVQKSRFTKEMLLSPPGSSSMVPTGFPERQPDAWHSCGC